MKNLLRVVVLAVIAPGCASYEAWRFGPSPQDHEILVGKDPSVLIVRAQVAVHGLEKVSNDAFQIRWGLRVQNQTAQTIELALDSFELVDADLLSFEPVAVRRETPGPGLVIGPKETALFEVVFPLPPGVRPEDLDLSGLNLRFGVIHEGRVLTANAHFERLERAYYYDPWYDPWYGPYWHSSVGFHVGFVSCD